MADVMKPREPGEPGSTTGDIKTPMCSENVGNKGGGKTHSYKGMPDSSGDAGLVKGPGAQGKWDAGISIKGSNANKY